MSTRRNEEPASALGLLEEMFHLIKAVPLSAWAVYYAATFPFVLAFLYFWTDMANHAFAYQRLAIDVTALSVLFVVLKTGHTLFARQLLGIVMEREDLPRPRILRIAMNQLIVQPTGFVVLPLCLFVVAPFGWAYAAYQNVTVLDDGRRPLRDVIREATEQAGLNQRQSSIMIWLLCPYIVALAATFFLLILPVMRLTSPEWTDSIMSMYAVILGFMLVPLCPFGAIVAVNLGGLLVMLPWLLKMLFGIDTPFTIGAPGAISPTFFVIVAGMTYLCLDPLIKIAYCLRCFYGASIHTGMDLRLKLKTIARTTLSVLLIALMSGTLIPRAASAQEAAAEIGTRAEMLNGAIDLTLQDRKFAWRFPRQRPESAETGFFAALAEYTNATFDWVQAKVKALRDWLEDLFFGRERDARSPGAVGERTLQTMVVLLLVALLGILVFVWWRTWRRRTVVTMEAVEAQSALPDLEDEGTTAAELPSNEWLRLARELMDKGDIRLAMRAYFFASLARLAHLRLIRIASYKSNRDYARELQRIAHTKAELLDSFSTGLRTFESVWYGEHVLSQDALRRYVDAQERIGHDA